MTPKYTPARLVLDAGLVNGPLAASARQERHDGLALRACALSIGAQQTRTRIAHPVEVTMGATDLDGLMDRVGRLDMLTRRSWDGRTASEAAALWLADRRAIANVAAVDAPVLARLAAGWSVPEEVARTAFVWAAGGALMARRLPGVDIGDPLRVVRQAYRRHDVPVAALDALWALADRMAAARSTPAFGDLDAEAQAIGRDYVADTGPVVTVRVPYEYGGLGGGPRHRYHMGQVWPDAVSGDCEARYRASVPETLDIRVMVQGAIGRGLARIAVAPTGVPS